MSKNRNIENLDLTGTDISQLKPLAQFTNLKKLELAHCLVTDAQLVHIERLQELVELDLGSTEVTDDGVKHLATLNTLETLCLADARITDSGAKLLAECHNLKRLQLAYSIGNGFEPRPCYASVDALNELKEKLPVLHIHGKPAERFTGMVGVVKNRRLATSQMAVSDLIGLPDKSLVQSIDLTGSIANDDLMESLEKFTNLKTLKLGRTWVTDSSLIRISNLLHLEELDLRDTRVTDVGVARLSACTNLKKLNLHNTMISGTAFRNLIALEKLVDLDVSRNRGDTKWSGRLDLSSGITDQGLAYISKLDWIERINLKCYHCKPVLTANGVRCLSNLKQLKEIGIYGLPINEEMLSNLKQILPDTKFDYKTKYGFFDLIP